MPGEHSIDLLNGSRARVGAISVAQNAHAAVCGENALILALDNGSNRIRQLELQGFRIAGPGVVFAPLSLL